MKKVYTATQERSTKGLSNCNVKTVKKIFTTNQNFQKHKCILITCRLCNSTHDTRQSFNKHLKQCIKKQKFPAPTTDFINDPLYPADDVIASLDAEKEVVDMYKANWLSLRTHAREGKTHHSYTFRWVTQNNPDWGVWLRKVFLRQSGRFKLNVAHSSILYNSELEDYKFFHASFNNENIWHRQRLIKNWEDMEAVAEELHNYDVLEQLFRQRNNTKSVVRRLCSTTFFVTVLPSHPLGSCCLDDHIPQHIVKNSNLVHFLRDQHTHPIQDNLCFFRCLAYHRLPNRTTYPEMAEQISTDAKFFYAEHFSSIPINQFCGVFLDDFDKLEEVYAISIDVFEFDGQQPPRLVPRRRSTYAHGDKKNPLRLLLVNGCHLSYIKDIDSLCNSFTCNKCGKVYSKSDALIHHVDRCNGDKVKHKYPGNIYTTKPTTLEFLRSHGVPVPHKFTYPYRVTYDFETYKSTEEMTPATSPAEISTTMVNGTRYFQKLKLLSVGVCSNVKSEDEIRRDSDTICPPEAWVTDGDTQALVNHWVDYLEAESDKAFHILSTTHFKEAFKHIEDLKGENSPNSVVEPQELETRLKLYLRQLPVVGFNSGNFDLNVVKPYLMKRLINQTSQNSDSVDMEVDDSPQPNIDFEGRGRK